MEKANSRVALVTGANKGIGFEVARQLGKAGCTVVIGARNPELGRAAAAKLLDQQIDARFVALDVNQERTVETAAATLASEFECLDILVNNAGIIATGEGDGPPSRAKAGTVERTLRTNFLGALIVVQAMLPLLRKSHAGRIVNISSGLGSLEYNGDPNWEFAAVKHLGYSASKAALNMLTVQLAFELRDTRIKVNSADPGFTATDLNQHRGYQTAEQGASEAVRLALLPADGPTGGFFSSAGRDPWYAPRSMIAMLVSGENWWVTRKRIDVRNGLKEH
jgi:NAD(P)-dependent dehydrogenase (short-subunit alcohol dehydrogenase family)